jgi:hypothetical protein
MIINYPVSYLCSRHRHVCPARRIPRREPSCFSRFGSAASVPLAICTAPRP